MNRPYEDKVCILSSMHQKEKALKESFEKILGCRLIPATINTDSLGTFTGEIKRKLSPLYCVKKKCSLGLKNEKALIGIANEGSFCPHPLFPLLHVDHEILYFKDNERDFDLSMSKIFFETNFSRQTLSHFDEVSSFIEKVLFPSHALIVRPCGKKTNKLIFKGIQNFNELEHAFAQCLEVSDEKMVVVETDMRAHMNPTRMNTIRLLAEEMAARLATSCPSCSIPGWGLIKKVKGLECESCGAPTEEINCQIYGCCKCDRKELVYSENKKANSFYCQFCNP